MIDPTANHNSENVIEYLSTPVSQSREGEIALPSVNEDSHKLIPRPQNQMAAEVTRDMFMSGSMCE